jgi:hypothetical protein
MADGRGHLGGGAFALGAIIEDELDGDGRRRLGGDAFEQRVLLPPTLPVHLPPRIRVLG